MLTVPELNQYCLDITETKTRPSLAGASKLIKSDRINVFQHLDFQT